MKRLLSFFLAISLSLPALANEGMWLPLLLNRNYAEMQELGLQLTPEQLYSINNSSLKDAIVSFGGFCTGEIISKNGLILTNHHCGYDAIQTHSSVENDYLTDGFWARSYSEEKPNEGLFVRFLVRMEDVSEKVLAELNDDMSESDRAAKIREVSKTLSDKASEGEEGYSANVRSFYHGNEFYLFVYETYNDVRLVGAPPSSVGKFGGDTDNWIWPRHTGDFSMFRVYTGPDGKPAAYAEENIPMTPKHHLPISLDGVKEGDFTMIFGYPGSTDRYLSSYGVEQAIEKYNPTVVKIRDVKLDIMKSYMQADNKTRIQYASKQSRVSNYWKYYIGQTEQLKNNKVYDKKKAIEDQFAAWVNAKPKRKAKYGSTLNLFEEAYKASDAYVESDVFVIEAGLTGADLTLFAFRFDRLMGAIFQTQEKMEADLKAAETDEEKEEIKTKAEGRVEALKSRILATAEEHFKNYNVNLDKELFGNLFQMYSGSVPKDQQPAFFQMVEKKFKGDFMAFADKTYEKSFLTSMEGVTAFLEKPKAKKLEKDYAAIAGRELYEMYIASGSSHAETEDKLEKAYRLFTAGVREMNPNKNYSADANSTMRMTYGTVGSYYPRDGVFYDYYTTAQGILQKEDPNDSEFKIQPALIETIKKNDFGQYGNEEGELPVCFISNNDITGGNSGSPVINAKGELIGCAFDGNWEAMSGDIFFEQKLQRTISVDARYILFIVDKYAGAQNIIDELTLAKSNNGPAVDMEAPNAEKETKGASN
jgi:hypothetical protein